jgi:hypothetical protein
VSGAQKRRKILQTGSGKLLLEQDLKGPVGLIRKASWGKYTEFAKRRVGERQKARKCLRNAMSTCRVEERESRRLQADHLGL